MILILYYIIFYSMLWVRVSVSVNESMFNISNITVMALTELHTQEARKPGKYIFRIFGLKQRVHSWKKTRGRRRFTIWSWMANGNTVAPARAHCVPIVLQSVHEVPAIQYSLSSVLTMVLSGKMLHLENPSPACLAQGAVSLNRSSVPCWSMQSINCLRRSSPKRVSSSFAACFSAFEEAFWDASDNVFTWASARDITLVTASRAPSCNTCGRSLKTWDPPWPISTLWQTGSMSMEWCTHPFWRPRPCKSTAYSRCCFTISMPPIPP